MSKIMVTILLLFLVLVPAQAVFFNNLVLFNVAVPLVFVYLIIVMPVTLSPNWAMTIGFLTGAAVDILSDTAGVNALACTILAFVRRPVFHLYVSLDDDLGGAMPSLRTMGAPAFLKYAVTMIVLYCAMVFVIESFHFFNPVLLGLRIVCSSAFTFCIILALASLSNSPREKKL